MLICFIYLFFIKILWRLDLFNFYNLIRINSNITITVPTLYAFLLFRAKLRITLFIKMLSSSSLWFWEYEWCSTQLLFYLLLIFEKRGKKGDINLYTYIWKIRYTNLYSKTSLGVRSILDHTLDCLFSQSHCLYYFIFL